MERFTCGQIRTVFLVLAFATLWYFYLFDVTSEDPVWSIISSNYSQKNLASTKPVKVLKSSSQQHYQPVFQDGDVFEPWKNTTEGWKPFQRIVQSDAWVYSAHFDHVAATEGHPRIIAFGILDVKLSQSDIVCSFTSSNDERTISVPGSITILPDQKETHFRMPPAYIGCPLRAGFHPVYVTFSFNTSRTSLSGCKLPVIYPSHRLREITVCFSVLHSHYNDAVQFITSVEFSRSMGSSHMFFYNYSLGPDVDRIARHYQKLGLVTSLPWPLPDQAKGFTWYFGQMAAVHDCVYRNRNSSEFVALPDMDELLVPRTPSDTWLELLRRIESTADFRGYGLSQVAKSDLREGKTLKFVPQNEHNCPHISPPVAVFTFQSIVFDPDVTANYWAMKFNFTQIQIDFILKHQVEPYFKFVTKKQSRSKLIVRPDKVVLLTIHESHTVVSCSSVILVGPSHAMQHHYRKTIKGNTGFSRNDTSFLALHVAHELLTRIISTYQKIPAKSLDSLL